MYKSKGYSLSLVLLLIMLSPGESNAVQSVKMQLIQTLKDGINGVDGLDNPRNTTVSMSANKVFVTSGDDNSLAVFTIGKNFKLTFEQIFKNSANEITGLEGATGVATLDGGQQIIVSGFYDGALSVFSRDNNSYYLAQTIGDRLNYERVFASKEPLEPVDTLGLLGAWDLATTPDEKQLFVASYMSNAVSIFDIAPEGKITLNHIIKNTSPFAGDLGKPVSVVLSPRNDNLFVLGFETHQLTVLERETSGRFSTRQVLSTGADGPSQCLNPQKLLVSPGGNYLYVACAGSDALAVFTQAEDGTFGFLQKIASTDLNGGLEGAGSLALSTDGRYLYAAGEAGRGLFLFETQTDGRLRLADRYPAKPDADDEFTGISSLHLTTDNQHLLVTAAKKDSLLILQVK